MDSCTRTRCSLKDPRKVNTQVLATLEAVHFLLVYRRVNFFKLPRRLARKFAHRFLKFSGKEPNLYPFIRARTTCTVPYDIRTYGIPVRRCAPKFEEVDRKNPETILYMVYVRDTYVLQSSESNNNFYTFMGAGRTYCTVRVLY